jgi:ketosteroid isomerase-like protein
MAKTLRTATVVSALVFACDVTFVASQHPASSPSAAVEELLGADRAFSAASARTDVITGLSAMFADDVVMPTPAGQFADGKAKAVEALRANPDNAASRVEWTPLRGGISADAEHGFTLGLMTLTRPDQSKVPLKYLSYWVKRPAGWRVAAYKRGRAAEGTPSTTPLAPSLPAALVSPVTDTVAIARHRESLAEAERAFSKDAQSIGLGPAFARYGRADATNMGGPAEPGFVVGAEAIAKVVSSGDSSPTSPLNWGPDTVIVASSGDLGVSIGMIRRNKPEPNQPAAFPFFTIWRRDRVTDSWRYIAE